MKNLKPLFAVCFIILFCSFAAADWVDLKVPEGRFELKFPKKPEAQVQNVDKSGMHLKMHLYMYDASKYKDENMVYLAMYCDYPEKDVSSDFKDELVDTIMKTSANGVAESMGGKVLSIERVNFKEFPCMKVKMDVQNGAGYAYLRLYLVHSRLYMVEVACETAKDHNTSIDKFFDSFTFTEKAKAPVKK